MIALGGEEDILAIYPECYLHMPNRQFITQISAFGNEVIHVDEKYKTEVKVDNKAEANNAVLSVCFVQYTGEWNSSEMFSPVFSTRKCLY